MNIETINDNNTDISLVYIKDFNTPHCKKHGAMNRVSEEISMWRCLGNHNDGQCRAGCILK